MRCLLNLILVLALADCASPEAGLAEQDAQPGRILVTLKLPAPHFRPDANYAARYGDEGMTARRRTATRLARPHGPGRSRAWPMPVLGLHCFVMEMRKPDDAADLAGLLSRDPGVAWAQPVQTFHAMAAMAAMAGEDPLYPLQPVARLWHLSELHNAALGRGVRVAVVDSGVESAHPDLIGQVEREENFVDGKAYVPEMHGTAVAGIIAARAGNGIGIAGVAPGARLLALRGCWQQASGATACDSFSLAKALQAAIVQGADVINLSLAGPDARARHQAGRGRRSQAAWRRLPRLASWCARHRGRGA
jgi:subtilisin family serine protease